MAKNIRVDFIKLYEDITRTENELKELDKKLSKIKENITSRIARDRKKIKNQLRLLRQLKQAIRHR